MSIVFVLCFDNCTYWFAGVLHRKSQKYFGERWHSLVGRVTRLQAGVRGIVLQFRVQIRDKSHTNNIQTGCGIHAASC